MLDPPLYFLGSNSHSSASRTHGRLDRGLDYKSPSTKRASASTDARTARRAFTPCSLPLGCKIRAKSHLS